jgi:superfamily II DNA or RNA helicase
MITPYKFQSDIISGVFSVWRQDQSANVAIVLPTGGGKTVVFSNIIGTLSVPTVVIAHRQELLQQASTTLARNAIPHNIIGQKETIKWICSRHYSEFGKDFYRPNSDVVVCGVDTLLRRKSGLSRLFEKTKLVVIDECHHVSKPNKWYKVLSEFNSSCKILGVTATLMRSDGAGLGKHSHGIFDTFVSGPNLRELIDSGYLSDYEIYGPETVNFDRKSIKVGKQGDFSGPQMRIAMERTPIIGDVVDQYIKIARGKLGVTFAPTVPMAEMIAENFTANGIPAKCVHAGTKDVDRQNAIDDLKNRKILELVNVDIFGEGFDLPAIEVVSFARPTESFILFCQQFGRALRTMSGKKSAIIIDHVGNVKKHGLPDYGRTWTLDSTKNKDTDPCKKEVKTCPVCTRVYPRIYPSCIHCGFTKVPTGKVDPEQVDGDLTLYDPATLEELRRKSEKTHLPVEKFKANLIAAGMKGGALYGAVSNHSKRLIALQALESAISMWAGVRRAKNIPDAQSYREFYLKFGDDVMSVGSYGRPQAEKLLKKIEEDIINGHI